MSDFYQHALAASRAICRDVVSAFPGYVLCGDICHIESHAKSDPHGFFLRDLPLLGKAFDQWLNGAPLNVPDSCILADGSVLYVSSILRPGASPQGLSVFELDPDPNEVLFIRQLSYMFKRTVMDTTEEFKVHSAEEFWHIDQKLREPRSTINARSFEHRSGEFAEGLVSGDCRLLRRLVRTLDLLSAWLTPCGELDLFSLKPKHGPGAVSDQKAGEDKYQFPTWSHRVDELFPATYFSVPNETFETTVEPVDDIPPARLIAVPKSYQKPRLIASEPVVHQFLQQGLMRWIRDNMSNIHRRSVNFTNQQPSRDAALAASKDGAFATVDLSAASDRLSCWVVESFFRKHPLLLEALLRTRSHYLVDPISGKEGELRKFAPMGSAVTFPVQSLVYATACFAAVMVSEGFDLKSQKYQRGKLSKVADQVRVFGDDIVIPSKAVPELGLLLEYLQLKVNGSKTHYLGFFRESCGMDAYKGYDVTPAYISHVAPSKPTVKLGAYVAQSNNAHVKGFWNLSTWMKNTIRPEIRRCIPVSCDTVGCIAMTTFCKGPIVGLTKISQSWQRPVVKGFYPKASVKRMKRDSCLSLLQYFTEEPDPQSTWTAGWDAGRKVAMTYRWEDARSPQDLRLLRHGR